MLKRRLKTYSLYPLSDTSVIMSLEITIFINVRDSTLGSGLLSVSSSRPTTELWAL